MKLKIISILFAILFVCSASSFAAGTVSTFSFEEERTGFSFGVSLGYTPYSAWNTDNRNGSIEGVNFGLSLGYNIDSLNLVSFVFKFPRFLFSMEPEGDFDSTFTFKSHNIFFEGLNWIHFFDFKSRNFYSELGAGKISTKIPSKVADRFGIYSEGWGVVVGGGVELNSWFFASVTYLGGRTTFDNSTINHNTVYFSLTLISE